MIEDSGQSASPDSTIHTILGGYPFSNNFLHDILQNSDDARATKQVFVLDRRHHGTKDLYHPYFARTQGPAFLTHNDIFIRMDDWEALKSAHQPSKVADTSKACDCGIELSSCYHVTDTPHILSGLHLAILDPKHEFVGVSGVRGGVRLDLECSSQDYGDHLAAFSPLFSRSDWGRPFHGTILRLPLRTSASQISNNVTSPDEISKLLRSFAAEELNMSLLFLRNVSSIDIYEITANGKKTQIASATINRTPPEPYGKYEIHKAAIQTTIARSLEKGEWRILHAPFSKAGAVGTLSKRLGGNPAATLYQHKLSPIVDLAIPLDSPPSTKIGRLFTHLPLPLRTGFPVHINALFALTQSRQNLRNTAAVGTIEDFGDRCVTHLGGDFHSLISASSTLIEWNRLLFDTYIPLAWAVLVKVLVTHDNFESILDVWPSPQDEVDSGDYAYWKDISFHVAHYALSLTAPSVIGTNTPYKTAAAILIADEHPKAGTLAALARAGLLVTQPPQYLMQVIQARRLSSDVLSPETAYSRLKPLANKIQALDDTDAQTILSYLLSTSNCRNIAGLPLIPSVSGARIALATSIFFRKSHVLLSEIEEDLFAIYDPDAVSLRQLEPDVREALVHHGPGVLNVAKLSIARISSYLSASPYASQYQQVATGDQIHWLNKFWDWVQTWSSDLRFFNRFNLVPTTKGFQRPTETVFDPQDDHEIASLLELLTVPVIDPRLDERARGALKQLQPSSNIHALLRTMPAMISVKFSESEASYLCTYLIKNLPSACARHGSMSADNLLRSRLRAFPIYPVISVSSDGGPPTRRTSIASTVTVRGVDPGKIPILPRLESVVYLDLRVINQDMLRYLDPSHPFPLSVSEMQDLILENFHDQSPEMEIAFIKHFSSHPSTIPRGTRILPPETAYRRLKPFADKLKALDATDVQVILRYLLSTLNFHNVVGLPLIPSVSGARLALTASTGFGKTHVLLDEIEEDLFAIYDRDAVSLRQLEPGIRKALVSHGPGVLNVTKLNVVRVFVYLCTSPYVSQSQQVATSDQIRWLNKFWTWAQTRSFDLRFFNRFNLVPTTNGLRRPSDIVFDPQADHEVARPFGVPVIDPRLNARARKALERLC